MENSIGDKIKELRKELKMTQGDLAGNKISKSMLSLIESDKATPSMKTLQYIAERLNKPVYYFIETNDEIEKKDGNDFDSRLFQQVEDITNSLKYLSIDEITRRMDLIIYDFNDANIVYADILTKFATILMLLNCYDKSEEYFLKAVDIYEMKNLYINAAKVYLPIHNKYYHIYNFNKCRDIIETATSIYSKSINRDNIFEIRLMYQKADFLMMTNDSNPLIIQTIDKAISLSYQSNNFSLELLYRLKALNSLYNGYYDEFKKCIYKSLTLCELTNSDSLLGVLNAIAIGENLLGDSHAALKAVEKFESIYNTKSKELENNDILYNYAKSYQSIVNANMLNINTSKLVFSCLMEKAKAYLRLKDYDNSYEAAVSIDFDYFYSRLYFNPDKVFFWKEKIYYAIILSNAGKYNEAISIIDNCIENLLPYDLSEELYFAYKCQSEVYSKYNDYEKAFNSLKKAEQYYKNISNHSLLEFYF